MRRAREWPRLTVAVVVLAVVLVLIGVVVASAASGGGGGDKGTRTTTGPATAPSTPLLKAPKSDDALLKSQSQTITRLRSTVSTQTGEIAKLQQQVKREREMRRIKRHAKAKHHKQQHANRR
jgi:TolA-binding protein